MHFLNVCENPDILRIIYFGLKILDLIFLIVPIALIIYITIDIFKIIIRADDKVIKENHKSIINRIIFAIFLFFVPTIVTVVMNILSLSNITTDYQVCIDNANKETIEALQEKKDFEEQNEENNTNKNSINKTELSGDLYQDLATRMISIASNEIGTKNGTNNDNKYGRELGLNNRAWCSIFTMWVAKKTTINGTNLFEDVFQKEIEIHNIASATNSIYVFNNSKSLNFYYSSYYGGNYTPKKGDLIYFSRTGKWDKNIYPTMHITTGGHVGIVEYVENGVIHTIEGNTNGGQVARRNRNLNSEDIVGFGSWYK